MSAPFAHASDALLRKLGSATPLSEAERQAVLALPAPIRSVPAGVDIVREGDRSSDACVVLSGWLCCYKLVSKGQRQILSVHIAGDLPDLQTLHLPVADFSMATLTETSVAFIPHVAIRTLTARFPALAAALWRDTLVGAAVFRQWMTGMGRLSSMNRLAHLLCEIYLRQEAAELAADLHCPLPLTQSDLADITGMTSVHVNRTLKEIRAQNLITLRAGTLAIHDWPALARLGEFDPVYLHLSA